MDVYMDGWMDIWMHTWMHGSIYGWIYGCMDGYMDGYVDVWMDIWLDSRLSLTKIRTHWGRPLIGGSNAGGASRVQIRSWEPGRGYKYAIGAI